jgi:hypothetical protein
MNIHLISRIFLGLPVSVAEPFESLDADGLSEIEFGRECLQDEQLGFGVHQSVGFLHEVGGLEVFFSGLTAEILMGEVDGGIFGVAEAEFDGG